LGQQRMCCTRAGPGCRRWTLGATKRTRCAGCSSPLALRSRPPCFSNISSRLSSATLSFYGWLLGLTKALPLVCVGCPFTRFLQANCLIKDDGHAKIVYAVVVGSLTLVASMCRLALFRCAPTTPAPVTLDHPHCVRRGNSRGQTKKKRGVTRLTARLAHKVIIGIRLQKRPRGLAALSASRVPMCN
jgi:hypothetical protein